MTDTTQPPAETLAIIEMLRSAEVQEGTTVFDHSAEEIGIAVMENHRAVLAALTRRAGGDAIPAGMTREERRLEDLKQMAAYAGPVVSFDVRDPYYLASCDGCGWVGSSEACGTDEADDVFCPRCHRGGADCGKIAERIATTPKPPAGGDAGVESIWDSYRLPCDVHLAPVTIIRAGCQLSTLKVAMEASWRPRHFEGHPNAALALPAPVVEGDSPYVAGPIWAEEDDECFTAEIQISGGHYVVATVHGATRDEVEQRQRAIIAALSEGRTDA